METTERSKKDFENYCLEIIAKDPSLENQINAIYKDFEKDLENGVFYAHATHTNRDRVKALITKEVDVYGHIHLVETQEDITKDALDLIYRYDFTACYISHSGQRREVEDKNDAIKKEVFEKYGIRNFRLKQ